MGHWLDKIKTVYGYYAKSAAMGAYPMHLSIELTNNCNLKCRMCPHQNMNREKGYMPEPLFKKIIDEVKGKSEFVYLYSTGESLLHPDFFNFAEYIRGKELKTCISTNITLLNEERSRKLIESGIDFIVLPLDGIDKQTYEKIRVGAQFEKNLLTIKRFLQLKIELRANCHVEVQFVLMDKNKDGVDHLNKLFTKEEISAINSFRIKPVYIYPSINTENIFHNHPCYFLWSMMTIEWDGKVPICCMDFDAEVVLGDIRESSIYEIWNNQKFAFLRELHKNLEYEKMPLCNRCLLPELKYFSMPTIVGSAIFHASTMRKFLSFFEKNFITKKRLKSLSR